MMATERPRLLLHVCCAPCTTAPVERLRDEYEIIAFFYNPNIYPREEYVRRLEEARRYCAEIGLPLIEGPFDPERWAELTAGLEGELEGGRRCRVCIEMRLRTAAMYAGEHGFDALATVLTVSPHKNAAMVEEIGGRAVAEEKVVFLARDFKKKDGFRRSIELSKLHELYRQDYCGCEPSLRERRGKNTA
jgi:predicted adenine nucleotide alpha hydrolase (AANH) superfamily ATPase